MTTGQENILKSRLSAQRLTGPPASSPEEVVRHLLAVQAQDPRGARLAVRARSQDVLAADVDDALTNRRSLVVAWLNRSTLHLVTSEDYWWLFPLVTPQLAAGNAHRLAQEGVNPAQAERAVRLIVEAITASGPMTRGELRSLLADEAVPVAGQALVHVLAAAAFRAQVVRGPVRDNEQCFVNAHEWLGPAPAALARDAALARLARRFLNGHGPASAQDLAKWAGIRLSYARAGLRALEDDLVSVGEGFVDLAGRRASKSLPPPRLLGPFDPVLHGWSSADFVLAGHKEVITVNGLFRPFLMVRGQAAGIWSLAGGQLTMRPFQSPSTEVREALLADSAQVLAYLGLPSLPAVLA